MFKKVLFVLLMITTVTANASDYNSWLSDSFIPTVAKCARGSSMELMKLPTAPIIDANYKIEIKFNSNGSVRSATVLKVVVDTGVYFAFENDYNAWANFYKTKMETCKALKWNTAFNDKLNTYDGFVITF